MKDESKICLSSGKPDGDPRETVHVDLDDMRPEQVLEMLLVFLAQNLAKAGMSDDFILCVRDEKRGRWGAMTSIRDVEKMSKILARLAATEPTDVEEKVLKAGDFTKRSN